MAVEEGRSMAAGLVTALSAVASSTPLCCAIARRRSVVRSTLGERLSSFDDRSPVFRNAGPVFRNAPLIWPKSV